MTWWRRFKYRVRRLICLHRLWEPMDTTFHPGEDGYITITWDNMRCLRCGHMRNGNLLRPGETVQIEIERT